MTITFGKDSEPHSRAAAEDEDPAERVLCEPGRNAELPPLAFHGRRDARLGRPHDLGMQGTACSAGPFVAPKAEPRAFGDMEKILVVEDDEGLGTLICEGLALSDFLPIHAQDGSIGLRLARSELPDLVISDVAMPNLSGTELLTALRNDPLTAGIPFILMTGRTYQTPMRQGMRLGADDYLPKPFRISEMVEAVRGLLKKHERARHLAETKVAELRLNLTASLPHEFLTPLTGIMGACNVILSDYDELQAAQILEMVAGIQSNGERLLHLIQNYLLYARVELFAEDANQSLFGADGQSCAPELLLPDIGKSQAEKVNRLPDLELRVATAPIAIKEEFFMRIADEIISNAFKFSEAGTRVEVTGIAEDRDYILSVIDHGRGMMPDQIAMVGAFQQFRRQFYEQQGMGLGLALTSRLAEVFGGRLSIRSRPGVETCVEVRLPRAACPMPAA